jgi:signal peptide peptidase SppA
MMKTDFLLCSDFAERHGINVPNLGDYFGLWSMYEQALNAAVQRINGLNLLAHIGSPQSKAIVEAQASAEHLATADGIAVFSINGPMMKTVSSLSGGTSTIVMRNQIRTARKDPEIVGGLLKMDTPGGTVRGNKDLADEVAAFAAVKPLYVFVEDMTASAGVSVASQATKRFANNASALYGAMGTYSVLMDYSAEAAMVGVKVHVIKAGDFKGMGEPGTAITPEQLAEVQRLVNSMNGEYLATIAQGLKKPLSEIEALADGRIYSASEAVKFGLIDGVQSFEQTYQQLVAVTRKPTPNFKGRTTQMEKATLAELKATFPNSSAEWRESQLEAGATLHDASLNYVKHVEASAKKEKEELQKQLDDARKGKKSAQGSLGNDPLLQIEGNGEYESETGDPIQDFNDAVFRMAGRNPSMEQRQNAIRAVASKKPELYQAYLMAANPGKRQQRMIAEKLEAVAKK